jgi:hypothetical protein
MSSLDAVLDGVLTAPGVTGAVLVDGVTGTSYAAQGEAGAAQDAHRIASLAAVHLHRAGCEGEVESVVVTTRTSHHVTLRVQRQGDPLLLSAVLDRERVALAWAMRGLTRHAETLLA